MKCSRCEHENREQAKFCEECAAPLARTCASCGAPLPVTAKFCPECAHPAGASTTAGTRFSSPDAYTPKHLAERILTSKGAVEGERKQPLGAAITLAAQLAHPLTTVLAHVYAALVHYLRGDFQGCARAADTVVTLGSEKGFRGYEFELRAATSLARLFAPTARRAEGRALLAGVYGRFTEGFGTGDLRTAKLLLEELAY